MSRSEMAFLTKILPRAQAAGEAVANHQFVTMLNPKYRGPNFKWEEFIPFAVGWAEASCWQSFSDAEWKRWKKDIVQAACTSAEYTAKRILKESGLLEWWPDPTRAEGEAAGRSVSWRHIADAPRDGSPVLLYYPSTRIEPELVAEGFFDTVFDGVWMISRGVSTMHLHTRRPTHWAPLPAPPAGGS